MNSTKHKEIVLLKTSLIDNEVQVELNLLSHSVHNEFNLNSISIHTDTDFRTKKEDSFQFTMFTDLPGKLTFVKESNYYKIGKTVETRSQLPKGLTFHSL